MVHATKCLVHPHGKSFVTSQKEKENKERRKEGKKRRRERGKEGIEIRKMKERARYSNEEKKAK